VIRLNEWVTALSVGFIAGLLLFAATNFLVLKGGKVVGPHLSLLGQVFVGYRVTFLGSLIGFAYAMAAGTIVGYFGAKLYNGIARFNERRSAAANDRDGN
jgi:hypothetical protein